VLGLAARDAKDFATANERPQAGASFRERCHVGAVKWIGRLARHPHTTFRRHRDRGHLRSSRVQPTRTLLETPPMSRLELPSKPSRFSPVRPLA
jgi:hypothetical protein